MSKWGVLSGKCVMITYFFKSIMETYAVPVPAFFIVLSLV